MIVSQGVRCWESPKKCDLSTEHRERIQKQYPWTWSPELEGTRDPNDCRRCFYCRRQQPWAHLLYQNEFRTYFGNESFTTGRPNSGLNKLTLTQVRQLIIEAGLDIQKFQRNFVKNDPPRALLEEPFFFSKEELQTCTAAILAQKPIK